MRLYLKRVHPDGKEDFVTKYSKEKVKFGKARTAYVFDSNRELTDCLSGLNFIEFQKTGYFASTDSDDIEVSENYIPFIFSVEDERNMDQHRRGLLQKLMGAFQT